MQRWGAPSVPATPDNPRGKDGGLYRWFDGVQYDQQLIPWLLFLRGGDRSFYEEAVTTSRYGMDVCTKHFTTRAVRPGFATQASSYPFPWLGPDEHRDEVIRQFLAMQGDRDDLDGVIWNSKRAAKAVSRQPRPRTNHSADHQPVHRRRPCDGQGSGGRFARSPLGFRTGIRCLT